MNMTHGKKEGISAPTWAAHQRQKNKKRPAEIVDHDEEDLDLLSDSEDDVQAGKLEVCPKLFAAHVEIVQNLMHNQDRIWSLLVHNFHRTAVRNAETQLIVAHYYHCVCHIILNGFD